MRSSFNNIHFGHLNIRILFFRCLKWIIVVYKLWTVIKIIAFSRTVRASKQVQATRTAKENEEKTKEENIHKKNERKIEGMKAHWTCCTWWYFVLVFYNGNRQIRCFNDFIHHSPTNLFVLRWCAIWTLYNTPNRENPTIFLSRFVYIFLYILFVVVLFCSFPSVLFGEHFLLVFFLYCSCCCRFSLPLSSFIINKQQQQQINFYGYKR